MLLHEFTDSQHPVQSLLTLLNLVKSRYQSGQITPKINTVSFLNLARNVGLTLDYATFAEIYETNDSLKNIIKNFNKQYIELTSDEDIAGGDESHSGPKKQQQDKDIVGSMAKQAVDI
jgi:hypothetical protein